MYVLMHLPPNQVGVHIYSDIDISAPCLCRWMGHLQNPGKKDEQQQNPTVPPPGRRHPPENRPRAESIAKQAICPQADTLTHPLTRTCRATPAQPSIRASEPANRPAKTSTPLRPHRRIEVPLAASGWQLRLAASIINRRPPPPPPVRADAIRHACARTACTAQYGRADRAGSTGVAAGVYACV